MKTIWLYLFSLAAFLLIDLAWLGLVASGLYRRYLGHLMAEQVNWWAAGIFYLLFVAGLTWFAIQPGVAAGDLRFALGRAALYGFITYATYDLTNMATLKGWPWQITLVDMAWGVVLASLVALVGYWAGRTFLG